MNESIAKGNWHEVKGQLKQKWSKLTDDELENFKGNVEELGGLLQKHYGYTKEDAGAMLKDLKKQWGDNQKKGNENRNNGEKSNQNYGQMNEGQRSEDQGEGSGREDSGPSHLGQKVDEFANDAIKKTKETAERVTENVENYGKALCDFMQEKPIQSLAIAAAAGIVLGLLLRKS